MLAKLSIISRINHSLHTHSFRNTRRFFYTYFILRWKSFTTYARACTPSFTIWIILLTTFFLVRFKSADISLCLSQVKIFENRQCEQKPVDTETRRLRSPYFVNREKLIRLLDTISSLLIDYYLQHEAADASIEQTNSSHNERYRMLIPQLLLSVKERSKLLRRDHITLSDTCSKLLNWSAKVVSVSGLPLREYYSIGVHCLYTPSY